MKVFITARFKGIENKKQIEGLCWIIRESWFEDFCFIRDVEDYQKIFNNPYDLWVKVKSEIEKCDAILIDFDGPASGRMIELWVAFAMKKKIILIVKKDLFVKDTIIWVTNNIIQYNELEDIKKPMKKLLELRKVPWK